MTNSYSANDDGIIDNKTTSTNDEGFRRMKKGKGEGYIGLWPIEIFPVFTHRNTHTNTNSIYLITQSSTNEAETIQDGILFRRLFHRSRFPGGCIRELIESGIKLDLEAGRGALYKFTYDVYEEVLEGKWEKLRT